MYWLDTTILIVLGLAALLGARTGLLTQVARLLALGLALTGTILCNPWVAPWLQEVLFSGAPAWVSRVVGYVAVFILIYALLWFAASLLERGVKAARLEWLNRVLGAVLGAGKAALLIGLICQGLSACVPDAVRDTFERSVLVPLLSKGVDRVLAVIPEEYRDEIWSAHVRTMDADGQLRDLAPPAGWWGEPQK